jgi:hypothetical protein
MVPTQQGLEAEEVAGHQIDHGVIDELGLPLEHDRATASLPRALLGAVL